MPFGSQSAAMIPFVQLPQPYMCYVSSTCATRAASAVPVFLAVKKYLTATAMLADMTASPSCVFGASLQRQTGRTTCCSRQPAYAHEMMHVAS